MTKERAYRELIIDVKNYYTEQKRIHQHEQLFLEWCDDCKEINLWTYWQGYNNLDAEIMLVGQDWGCFENGKSDAVLDNIKAINDGISTEYLFDTDNPTDCNLAKLFQSVGISIVRRDSRLFFTNFILGYRNKGLTGGVKSRWFRENEEFFQRLVSIIEPRIIICLGRTTFLAVSRSFGKRITIRNYNEFIIGDNNPLKLSLPSGKTVHVFAMSHCGAIGTLNRNRPKDAAGKDGMALQIQDWQKMKAYL